MKNSPHLLKNAIGPFCVALVLFFLFERVTEPTTSFLGCVVSGIFMACFNFLFEYLFYRFLFSRKRENIPLLYLICIGDALLFFLPYLLPV